MAAAKKNEKTEAKDEAKAPEAPKAPEAKAPEAAAPASNPAPTPSTKVRPAGIGPGRIVLFTREVFTNSGGKTVQLPAIILNEADAASNFQPHDGAVDLKVFTKHGDEVKNGVMFSEEYAVNKWSFPKKA